MEFGKRDYVRPMQVAGLAVVALVVAWVFGSPDLGLLFAGAIVAGELLWAMGSLFLRSRRRKHLKTKSSPS